MEEAKEFCARLSELGENLERTQGIHYTLLDVLRNDENWFLLQSGLCLGDTPDLSQWPELRQKLSLFKPRLEWLKTFLDSLEDYHPKTASELRPLPSELISHRSFSFTDTPIWPFDVWRNLPNSSTNGNRKRAAYVLKRFFCDDLNPLGTLAPDHPNPDDRHASDPSCQACHYKLDPMAGFFRNHGVIGLDFANTGSISFDDGVSRNLDEYTEAWRDPFDPIDGI